MRTLALLAAVSCCTLASAPVSVREGRLWQEGRPLRAIGVNYCDFFQELLGNPESDRTLQGLRFLGEQRIPSEKSVEKSAICLQTAELGLGFCS